MFKESFKFYKSKEAKSPDFSEVLDFNKLEELGIEKMNLKIVKLIDHGLETPPGIQKVKFWKCYQFQNGLIFLQNPFTKSGQRYWMARCLQDYPKTPNVVNLNPKIFNKNVIDDWWSELQNALHENVENDNDGGQKQKNSQILKLKNSMRWATLGYHHNWDTKIYSDNMKNKFPNDLAKLSEYFAKVLGLGKYSAEAAIVNFYPIGTTLSGHTDHSEVNLEAPLFSFSFGQTAIFLIGGQTKDVKPTALFLRSGDIVVMSKISRLSYHAVPRVMKSDLEPWNETLDVNGKTDESDGEPSNFKKIKLDGGFEEFFIEKELWNDCTNELFWKQFNDHIKDCRININVRQVLFEGQKTL